jgi:hypothetical protein
MLGSRKLPSGSVLPGVHLRVCPVSWTNRTKIFHVKHFGTIDRREEHTFAAQGFVFWAGSLSGDAADGLHLPDS